jgi:hypothetical protein
MGGGSITDAELVVVGSGGTESGDSEGKGFYSLDGNTFTQINEPSFDQAPFPHQGIGYNTTLDILEPKWAVVGDPLNLGVDRWFKKLGCSWKNTCFYWIINNFKFHRYIKFMVSI